MSENLYLMHYGIKGQKWYLRRFQNEDGTLTEEGKRRYYQKTLNKLERSRANSRSDQIERTADSENYAQLLDRAIKRGKDTDKLSLKKQAADDDVAKSTKDIRDIDKKINNVIAKAVKDGYSVDSRECKYAARAGEQFVISMAAVGIGVLMATAIGSPGAIVGASAAIPTRGVSVYSEGGQFVEDSYNVNGHKYNVKKKG